MVKGAGLNVYEYILVAARRRLILNCVGVCRVCALLHGGIMLYSISPSL